MRLTRRGLLPIAACLSASLLLLALRGGEPPRTGPETEKRFPPLQELERRLDEKAAIYRKLD